MATAGCISFMTVDSTSHFRILDLPPELVQNVASHVQEDNFFAIRMTCRAFERACVDVFALRYVRDTSWHVANPKHLRQAKWLLSSRWASKVRTFDFSTAPTYHDDQTATVPLSGQSHSDAVAEAEVGLEKDDMQLHHGEGFDQAIAASILRDLQGLNKAALGLSLTDDTPATSIARDLLHAVVCAETRLSAINVDEIYDIDTASLGISGLLELRDTVRGLQTLSIHMHAVDLVDHFPSYSDTMRQDHVLDIILSMPSRLEFLKLQLTPSFSDLCDQEILEMTEGLLLANPLSYLTSLDLFSVCSRFEVVREVLRRCIPTLEYLHLTEVVLVGDEDCWRQVFGQLRTSLRLNHVELGRLCRVRVRSEHIGDFGVTDCDVATFPTSEEGVHEADRSRWEAHGTGTVAWQLEYLSTGTWDWEEYENPSWLDGAIITLAS